MSKNTICTILQHNSKIFYWQCFLPHGAPVANHEKWNNGNCTREGSMHGLQRPSQWPWSNIITNGSIGRNYLGVVEEVLGNSVLQQPGSGWPSLSMTSLSSKCANSFSASAKIASACLWEISSPGTVSFTIGLICMTAVGASTAVKWQATVHDICCELAWPQTNATNLVRCWEPPMVQMWKSTDMPIKSLSCATRWCIFGCPLELFIYIQNWKYNLETPYMWRQPALCYNQWLPVWCMNLSWWSLNMEWWL